LRMAKGLAFIETSGRGAAHAWAQVLVDAEYIGVD
jgi:hypothetical protein